MSEPASRPVRTRITDDQLARIVDASPEIPTTDLARELGVHAHTIYRYRLQLKTLGGLACPIAWKTCAICGGPLAARRVSQRVHVACQPALNAQIGRATYRKTVETLGPLSQRQEPARRRQMIDRLHDGDRRDQALTRDTAIHAATGWTTEEDAYLRDHLEVPARELALDLGRTLYSVRHRKVRLRRQLAAAQPIVLRDTRDHDREREDRLAAD